MVREAVVAGTGDGRPWSRSGDRWAIGAIAAIVLAGGLLRVAMARGDLWLDEAWSLDLVKPLGSGLEVFTAVSHDNNHFLNSLWLFWLGQDRAPWAYRAPAVLLGTLAIGLAAGTAWHRSRASAVIAAALTAVALPFVIYGSEARGYAGLMAGTMLSIAAFEAAVATPPDAPAAWRARWILGGAIGIGALFHLTAVAILAVLGLAALLTYAGGRSWLGALDATVALFRPALVCLIPAMASVMAGIVHRGGFELGGNMPAAAGSFTHGYGDQLRFALGLPPGAPASLCFACAGLGLLLSSRLSKPSPTRRAMIFAATVALPAGMLAFRLPNLQMARYYIVAGIVLLLSLADLLGALWQRGSWWRGGAAALLALFVAAQGAADASALALGRGRYGDLLADMVDPSGHVRYATHDTFWFETVARRAVRRRAIGLDPVPDAGFCNRPPDWWIDIPADRADPEPDRIMAGPAACRSAFTLQRLMRPSPLSGMTWAVYRRAP